ncbi:helix-turn-helix domain-containing protein [Caulobacter segnis]
MAANAGWSGKIWIGRDWWCFEGASGDSKAHGHLCAQVVAGLDGPARVEGEAGIVEAPVVLIPPGACHRLLGGPIRAIYPRPLGRLARRWEVERWSAVAPAPAAWAPLEGDLAETLDAEAALGEGTAIDPRLKLALHALDSDLSLADLAARAGLSAPRLRALAQAELGAPLAHWRLWLRLETALLRLRAGEGLAIAAAEAGFADQSHLNRAMSRFFGITPLTVARLLDPLPR